VLHIKLFLCTRNDLETFKVTKIRYQFLLVESFIIAERTIIL